MSDDELRQRAPKIAVYARVTAEHKLRIIRAWKANDAVVAMTGDGVNDAPAIKGADIGIAMGKSGTEVTKQAADMIITDDNFATIVAAVEEGRGIYDNIRKTLQYLLAGNTGELLLMTICVVVGLPTPLLPIHLLWINLVTDGLPALCLATDPIDPDVMKRHPRRRSERITDRSFLGTMFLTGFLTAGVAFAVYLYVLKTGTAELARTHAFAVLVFAELLRSFGARSETKPVWRISLSHQHQSRRRRGRFLRPPGVEPPQRDVRAFPENVIHAARRLLPAARSGSHPAADAGDGEAGAEQTSSHCVCRPAIQPNRAPVESRQTCERAINNHRLLLNGRRALPARGGGGHPGGGVRAIRISVKASRF